MGGISKTFFWQIFNERFGEFSHKPGVILIRIDKLDKLKAETKIAPVVANCP
jgi:hypothetical protein